MTKEGILNIYKPQNMTSHDVVRDLRRLLCVKRIGHTGTLDPMAEGVLPVCVGSTARVSEYLDLDFKKYRCTMVLGTITDTLDIWGNVVETKDTSTVDEMQIREAFESFRGEIIQIPPMYSAVRVNGRRLYDYARAGETVEVKKRKAYINELIIESIDLENFKVTFTVECTKGTYIRTICSDVGEILGTGAAMTALTRLSSGIFKIEDAIELEKLKQMDKAEVLELMKCADYPLVHFGKAVVNLQIGKKFVDGWHVSMTDCKIEKEPEFKDKDFVIQMRDQYRRAYNIYMKDEDKVSREIFLGVAFYDYKYKKLVADKVFFREYNDENI